MKLLNQTLSWLSISILIIVAIWAVLFYVNMMDEIYDSIDDGLRNYKLLIINKSEKDSTILNKQSFDESNYSIVPIGQSAALSFKDNYKDTLIYMEFEEDLEPVRMLTTAFKHHSGFYQLKVISSMVEEDDLIEDLFWSIFWLYIILVVSIVIINNLVLRKLWKPFYNLLNHLKGFRLDKDEKLPDLQTNTREFLELHKASNTLIIQALETYSRQKQFTENAAHELQTPLAIATNKLELLLENEDMKASEAEKVGDILSVVARMTQLNKSLLLLSKIENKQFFNNQTSSLNQTIRESINDLEDFAQFKRVTIQMEDTIEVNLVMDATLINILVSNLLKNAVFHNKTGGLVQIIIDEKTLEIKNTSSAEKLDKQIIFNRFYKASANQNSSGLGLPIVQAICELYHFKIIYSHDGMHSFKIFFS